MIYLAFDVFTRRWVVTGRVHDAALLCYVPTLRRGRLVRLRWVRR